MARQDIPLSEDLRNSNPKINSMFEELYGKTPLGDPASPEDGHAWVYDAESGGWLPKAVAPASHAGSRDGHPLATDTEPGFQSAAHRAKTERALDVETSQRVVYVSPNGIDSGSGSSTSRWKTIQYAVNQARAFMQVRNGASFYRIFCTAGTYEGRIIIPPSLFAGFNAAGQGGVWITSETGVASDVLITDPSTAWPPLINCYGNATIEKVTLEHDDTAFALQGSGSYMAYVSGCLLRRRSLANGGFSAIHSVFGKVLAANNSSEAGRLFAYGLNAGYGGVIAKNGTQPSGSTANEVVSSGGVIR